MYKDINNIFVILYMSYFTVNGQNLIPTGTVCSYLGTTDPTGWVICDGTARTDNTDGKYNSLNSLGIGTGGGGTSNYTPPDFRGAFLRGSGSQTYNSVSYSGPNTRDFQQDALTAPSSVSVTNRGWYNVGTNSSGNDCIARSLVTSDPLDASTGISVTVNFPRTATDVRPFNCGVNWILKL